MRRALAPITGQTTPTSRLQAAHNAADALAGLLQQLDTTTVGLTEEQAATRLSQVGANEPSPEKTRSKVVQFLRSFASPLTLILLAASFGSAMLGQVFEAALIVSIVIISALVNFVQTYRSERAVHSLRTQIAPTATVLRSGRWKEIARREIVPGDIIRLSAGDLVPADARLAECVDLHVQQAALTGESLPAEKSVSHDKLTAVSPDSPSLVFLGTSIVSGTATAIVFATGARTAFGDIAAHLSTRPDETEFERGMRHFGVLILETVFFLVLFLLVVDFALGRSSLESLLFAVALAVGLTPEFLPMITTVTLAQGAVRLARRKVIVKHLSAIQNLGSIDILCSDKTGTLTAGTMSLDASLDVHGQVNDRALAFAQLNSLFETGIKSPLDAAILMKPLSELATNATKTDEIPFDFERRRLSVVVQMNGGYVLVSKGAPESVLDACSQYEVDGTTQPLDRAQRQACTDVYRSLSLHGFRVLGVAYRKVDKSSGYTVRDERDLVFTGFLTFADHLLDGVAKSITALRRDGVRVKILTGDNELVSRYMCTLAGIDASQVVLGSEIESMTDAALAHVAEQADLFARVSPAQKHRIIVALKARRHVVGFLGDGINDAPSLHGADVGISVAGAADVAKDASDIILLERNLDVLHAGIIGGRQAFGNVLKYLLMGTSSNFGNMFSMAGAALFLPFLPMLPAQILLNNFLYDLAQITIPTDNIDPLYVQRPQRWDMSIVRRFMLIIGPLSSIFDFMTFYVLLSVFGFGAALFHTGWFVESLATQALVLLVIRTVGRPWTNRPSKPLVLTTLLVVLVAAALPYTPLAHVLGFSPLPAKYFAFLGTIVGAYLVLVELVKSRVMARLLRHTLPVQLAR